ncbi:MAG: VWA domain-containing protein [bacterium]|nr:VWA domain-containing protein [bacterium]
MRPLFRPALLTLACATTLPFPTVVGQDAGSSFGHARTREAAALGKLPTPLEVAVADIVNYHHHRLPLPRNEQSVMLQVRCGNVEAAPGDEVVVQFGYTTAPGDDRADLPPLNLALVIDCSGSMEEAGKMVQVKRALTAFAERLRPDDCVTLVTYSSEARVQQPGRRVADGCWLRDAIAELEPGGATNLHAGLMLALREVATRARGDSSNRVLLLTDGIANRGETDAERILTDAAAFTREDIDLSTIGVGRDLDISLLDRLARGGRGLFHYVADARDVQKVFVDEHEALVAPVARRVDLEFELPRQLRLDRVVGHGVIRRDGRHVVALPNLNRGATGVVLAVCRVRHGGAGRSALASAAVINVRAQLTYRAGSGRENVRAADELRLVDESGRRLRDPEVRKNYTIAVLAEGMHDMAKEAERRKWAVADRALQDALDFSRRQFASDDDEDVARVRSMAEAHSRTLRRYVDRFRDF